MGQRVLASVMGQRVLASIMGQRVLDGLDTERMDEDQTPRRVLIADLSGGWVW